MKKFLISGVALSALIAGSTAAFAGDATSLNLLVGASAVSNQEMNQVGIQVQANPNLLNIAGQDTTFGDNTFGQQILNNNNFATSSNAQQGGQISIAVAVN